MSITLIPAELRRARGSLFAVFFAQGAGFALLFSRLPAIKDRFELSDTALSLLTLGLPLLAGVATLVTGSVVRRAKSDVLLRVAILLQYVALVGIGFAANMALLLVAWVVMGLAFGTVDATMNMKAVTLQERYGRSIVVGFYAVYSFAGIVAALVAAASAAAGMSLGSLMVIAAVLLVPLLLATGRWLWAARLVRGPVAGTSAGDSAVRVPWGPVVKIGIVLAAAFFIESSAASWGAVYVRDSLGSTESVAALAFAAYSGAMLIGRISADTMIRWLGELTVVRSCASIALVGTVLVVLAPAPVVAILGFALSGVGLCVIAPLAFAAAGRLDARGSAVARANSFTYVGFLLGAALIGPVADLSSMRFAYIIPMLLAMVLFLIVPRIVRARPEETDETDTAAPAIVTVTA